MPRLYILTLLLLLAGCGTYEPLSAGAVEQSLDRGNGCFNAINCSGSHNQ